MSQYPGKYCQGIELSTEVLSASAPLVQVDCAKITNGLIIEFVRLRRKKNLLWRDVINWLIQLFGSKWPYSNPPAN